MGARSKAARKIRSADEFDLSRLSSALRVPRGGDGGGSSFAWSLETIRAARADQMRGSFARPARLVEGLRTDDAFAVAYENRLEPLRCLPVELLPAPGARGASIAVEAEGSFGQNGVGVTPETISDVHGCLVDHGVAFGVCSATPREDGTRVDFEMHSWPIENVRWDPLYRVFKTRVDPTSVPKNEIRPQDLTADAYGPIGGGYEVPIIHGDGRWVIFSKHEQFGWRKSAAVLAAALVWAVHANAVRDWAKGSLSHGSAKVIGSLPAGVPLVDKDGKPTAEAKAMFKLLSDIAGGDSPVGLKPAGADANFIMNSSTAWQVWAELVKLAERAAARIYLGTDGTLGAQGGAPGVDIAALFGVAFTRVKADVACIERGILTGIIEPWTAINFGDSTLAPKRKYQLPDPDEKALQDGFAARRTSFYADIASARSSGFDVTQAFVDKLAEKYLVPSATLAITALNAPSARLTANDIAGTVITVNEARASAGRPPLAGADGMPDPRGSLTVAEFTAGAAAPAPAATPAAAGAAPLRLVPPPAAPAATPKPADPAAAQRATAEHAARMTAALLADIREAQHLGLEMGQAQVDATAALYGVPSPRIVGRK